MRAMVQGKAITAGHARAMLPLVEEGAIVALANEVRDTGLSVRDVERRVQARRPEPAKGGRKGTKSGATASAQSGSSAELRRIEGLLASLTPEQRIKELEVQLREAQEKARLFEAVIDVIQKEHGVRVVKKPLGRSSRKSSSKG